MPSTVKKTVKPGGGGDYTSLESWESAEQADLITNDEIHYCECYSGGNLLGTPSNQFRLTGWRTDSTRYIILYAASGHEHQGKIDTSKAYAKCTAYSGTTDTTLSRSFWISEDIKIQNLQFMSTSRRTDQGVLFVQAISNLVEVDGCIIENDRPSAYSGTAVGVRIQNPIATKFHNNIIIMRPNSSSANVYALDGQQYGGGTAPTHEIYNNTIAFAEDCGRASAIRTQWPTLDSENNYFYLDGTTSETYYNTALGASITQGSNDKTDSDAAYSTATFASVTDGSEDFTLVSGSNLIDAGTTLSSVTTDAVGTSRPSGSSYDVGAMEFAAATNHNVSATNITGEGKQKSVLIQSASGNLATQVKMTVLHEKNEWEDGYPIASCSFGYKQKQFAADVVNLNQTGVSGVNGIFSVVTTKDGPPRIMPQYNSENVYLYYDLSNTVFRTVNLGEILSASDAHDLDDLTINGVEVVSGGNDIKSSDTTAHIYRSDIKTFSTNFPSSTIDMTAVVALGTIAASLPSLVVFGENSPSESRDETYWKLTAGGSAIQSTSASYTLSTTAIAANQIRSIRISGSQAREYVNGTIQGSSATSINGDLNINAAYRSVTSTATTSSNADNVIKELLIFDEALSEDDLKAVEAGLAQKYSVTSNFPSGHPAADAGADSLYDSNPGYISGGTKDFLTQSGQSFHLVSNSKYNLTNETLTFTIIDCRKSPGQLNVDIDVDNEHA